MMKLSDRLWPRSIRARLSVLFSLVFGTALILTSFVCFKVFTRAHLQDFDAFLYNRAVDIGESISTTPAALPVLLSDAPIELKKHRLFSIRRTYAQISDASGQIVALSSTLNGEHRLPLSKTDYQEALYHPVHYRNVSRTSFSDEKNDGETAYRMLYYLTRPRSGPPLLLQIAAPLTSLDEDNWGFLLLLLILIPCSILVSGVLGYVASRRAFLPVMHMTQRTAQIEMRNLGERIQVEEKDAELKELGRTLNLLLERVEAAVLAQERFVADASHQLKTPLAIMRGELELLQSRPGHDPEVREALKNASQEVSQLITLVENLLLLARMDAGMGMISFQLIRLDELLAEAIGRLQFIAVRRRIKLSWSLTPNPLQPEGKFDFEFRGDGDLIRCLMENLIENALKYSPEDSDVAVHLKEEDDRFLLEIIDHGRGMSESEQETIFNRFWRDPKKSLSVSGAGLGLAIVKKIADLHHGTIQVASVLGKGSTFTVQLSKD